MNFIAQGRNLDVRRASLTVQLGRMQFSLAFRYFLSAHRQSMSPKVQLDTDSDDATHVVCSGC